MTPFEAISNGASKLVIGRAITKAKDPNKVFFGYLRVYLLISLIFDSSPLSNRLIFVLCFQITNIDTTKLIKK